MPDAETRNETRRKLMTGREYIGLDKIDGPLVFIRNTHPVGYRELVECVDRDGNTRLGMVLDTSDDVVVAQIFEGTQGLTMPQTRVRFRGKPLTLGVSEKMLGRVFDGLGRPIDGGPAPLAEAEVDVNGRPINPTSREYPRDFIQTGISAIDGMNTLVMGQKLPLFSGAGMPHDLLAAQIVRQATLGAPAGEKSKQAEDFAIVFAAMGVKHDVADFFKNSFAQSGALSRVAMFLNLADDPPVERLITPRAALTLAEYLAFEKGKHVLVVLTDMTNFADALKEIAITMEQVPSNRGYPGDLYSQLASRYEKAVDFDSAGSVTILAATTMPGDDVTHPVPDNTGYITEGQFYLRNGRIEPFGSLSRLKQQVNDKTRDDHRAIMDGLIQLYAQYNETEEKRAMGFRMSEWDKKLLKYGKLFEANMMDLSVNISLEKALDKGWEILAECFTPEETRMKTDLINKFWPEEAK